MDLDPLFGLMTSVLFIALGGDFPRPLKSERSRLVCEAMKPFFLISFHCLFGLCEELPVLRVWIAEGKMLSDFDWASREAFRPCLALLPILLFSLWYL